MTIAKRNTLLAVTGLILFLQGGYFLLDWMRLFPKVSVEAAGWYRADTKLLVVFLCAFLAWIIGRDGLGRQDPLRMKIIFVIIALADIFFNRNLPVPGVAVFCVAQLALSARHAVGLRQAWRDGSLRRRAGLLGATGLGLALGIVVLVWFFYTYYGVSVLFWWVCLYTLLLSLTFLLALAAVWAGYYPRTNAVLMAVGMGLFLCCDITVIMRLGFTASGMRIPSIIAASLTWIFYTPTVYLLALSGYRWPLLPRGDAGDKS